VFSIYTSLNIIDRQKTKKIIILIILNSRYIQLIVILFKFLNHQKDIHSRTEEISKIIAVPKI